MDNNTEAEVIAFPKPNTKLKVVTKCAFCGKDLVKGQFLQESETSPAICFNCVKVCSDLMELK